MVGSLRQTILKVLWNTQYFWQVIFHILQDTQTFNSRYSGYCRVLSTEIPWKPRVPVVSYSILYTFARIQSTIQVHDSDSSMHIHRHVGWPICTSESAWLLVWGPILAEIKHKISLYIQSRGPTMENTRATADKQHHYSVGRNVESRYRDKPRRWSSLPPQ